MAKAESHKGQHWIPRSYLAAWTDPDCPPMHEPFVHVFSKDGKAYERRAPHNIFVETDLYTIRRSDGARDLRLEHGLAGLEKEFVRIRNEYLSRQRQLPAIVYFKLLVFVAAMHARTPTARDHHAAQWAEVKKVMDELEERMKHMTAEEKRRAASLHTGDPSKGMTHDQVKQIVDQPMQHILRPLIEAVATCLSTLMQCSVLCTRSSPGFITSDNPVTWFDSEAHKRSPMFRSPAFAYKTLEVAFPASPQQLLLFTRGIPTVRYLDWPDAWVDEVNRRTRGHSDKHFVVSRDALNPFWLDLGKMPDDAWEVLHPEGPSDEQS